MAGLTSPTVFRPYQMKKRAPSKSLVMMHLLFEQYVTQMRRIPENMPQAGITESVCKKADSARLLSRAMATSSAVGNE